MKVWPLAVALALGLTACAAEAGSGASSTSVLPTTTVTTIVPASSATPLPSTSTTTAAQPTTTLSAPVELDVVADPPDGGIGVVDGESIVLMDYAGNVVATGSGHSDVRSGPSRVSVGFSADTAVIVDSDSRAEPGSAGYGDVYSSAQRGSLLVTTSAGDAAVRSLLRLDPFTSSATLLAGPPPPLGTAPEGRPNPAGSWVWAIPSEQGNRVLGQWSGECEIPTAFVIDSAGEMSAVGVVGDDWSEAPGSFAAGWTPAGLPIVGVWTGGCGPASTPGVYLVDDETLVPIYLSETDTPEVFIWLMDPLDTGEQYYYNRREELLSSTYQIMGVTGAGEPSHGGSDANIGFEWDAGFIWVLAIDIGWVLDQIAEPAIATYEVGQTTVGVFPAWPDRSGTETHVFFCGDTGFALEGDIERPAVEALATALGCG